MQLFCWEAELCCASKEAHRVAHQRVDLRGAGGELARPAGRAPAKSVKKAPSVVRRSGRLASKKAGSQEHVMSKAKRLICKKLGVIFEEGASDEAALLARYAASFDAPLSEAQITALTALAQRGAEKNKVAPANV